MTKAEFENLKSGNKVYYIDYTELINKNGAVKEHEVADKGSDGLFIQFKDTDFLGEYCDYEITRMKAIDVMLKFWQETYKEVKDNIRMLKKLKKKEARNKNVES